MFIGGGSAGTAGGIKVTTFVLLAFVIWPRCAANPTSTVRPPVAGAEQRQALTVALLGVALVGRRRRSRCWPITGYDLDRVLFEAISAFGTVGLSTGITADAAAGRAVLLIVLMFVGRVGPITLASALALRERRQLLPTTRGATHRWLSELHERAPSSSSAWAGSAPRWPRTWPRLGHEVLAVDDDADARAGVVRPAHPRRPGRLHRRSRAAPARRPTTSTAPWSASAPTSRPASSPPRARRPRHPRHLGQGDHAASTAASSNGSAPTTSSTPNSDMGERVAHLVTGRLIDYIEFDDGFAIVKMRAPRETLGQDAGRVGAAQQVRRHHRRRQTPRRGLHLRPPGHRCPPRRPADRVRPGRRHREIRPRKRRLSTATRATNA